MLKNGDLGYYKLIAEKWRVGSITPEEKKTLEEWYNSLNDDYVEINEEYASNESIHAQRIFSMILEKIKYKNKLYYRRQIARFTAAAVAFLILGSSIYFFIKNKNIKQTQTTLYDIPPGINGATLHLANGTEMSLNKDNYGNAIEKVSSSIPNHYKSLTYKSSNSNEVVTTNGEQWRMILPDGTSVSLNAGSSIRFSQTFNEDSERIVELTGEAYFNVSHTSNKPFIVKAGNQEIKDLGTVFNVSNYPGETLKATLISGAIKVGNYLLTPGQQAAVIDNKNIEIKKVNTHAVAAWVEGQFSMESISLIQFMNQVARWYNVDVVYSGTPPTEIVGGFLDRNVPISNIISVLNAAGIKAKIESRKIIISSK